MKISKVHKRLAKIEALISDLTERYEQGAVHVKAALQGAKVAVAHLKTAVTTHAASTETKKSETKKTEPKKGETKKAEASSVAPLKPEKRKLSAAHKRAIREGVQKRLAQKQAMAATSDTKPASTAKKAAGKKKAV